MRETFGPKARSTVSKIDSGCFGGLFEMLVFAGVRELNLPEPGAFLLKIFLGVEVDIIIATN